MTDKEIEKALVQSLAQVQKEASQPVSHLTTGVASHTHSVGPYTGYLPGSSIPGTPGPMGPPGQLQNIAATLEIGDLIEMLEVESGGPAPHVLHLGVQYSFLHIMAAMMNYMARLNVLLVHRLTLGNPNHEE